LEYGEGENNHPAQQSDVQERLDCRQPAPWDRWAEGGKKKQSPSKDEPSSQGGSWSVPTSWRLKKVEKKK